MVARLDVLNLSALVADIILPIPGLPLEAGRHQMARAMFVQPGGVANTLIMAARLGLRTGAMGYVGDDVYGREVIRLMALEGIDVSGVVALTGSTTDLSFVVVDEPGQHVFLGVLGTAAGGLLPPDWRSRIEGARSLYVSGWAFSQTPRPAELIEATEAAQDAGCPVFFDPGPMPIDPAWLRSILRLSTAVLLTRDEATGLLGVADEHEAAEALLELGVELVAVKLGSEGCLLARPAERLTRPAFRVTVRDTVGAGDAFDAACLYAYLEGWPLARMADLANATGAATVARLGTGTMLPTRSDVWAVLESQETA